MGSTIQHLYQNVFEEFAYPVPPMDEQNAISAFLDRETAKIDDLVMEQQILINLLKEKRQAAITEAVTRGLDADATVTRSSILKLDGIPSHWGVERLKWISPEITVGIVVEPSKFYADEGVPALRSLNVKPGRIHRGDMVYISDEANELLAKSRLHSGDLVAVRTGQPGTCAVIPPDLDGCNCIDLIIIRKPEAVSAQYLRWFLSSDIAIRQFSEGSGGAIQQHFNVSAAKDLQIIVPPLAEQVMIVAHIEAVTSAIDGLIDAAEAAVGLLRERRGAMISAVVTGQIDVQGLPVEQQHSATQPLDKVTA